MEQTLPFCACGCGEHVSAPKSRFVHHHHVRTAEYKERMSKKARANHASLSPEQRACRLEKYLITTARYWEDPERRVERSLAVKHHFAEHPETRPAAEIQKQRAILQWKSAEHRQKVADAWQSAEKRRAASIRSVRGNAKRWNVPGAHEKQAEIARNRILNKPGMSPSVGKLELLFFDQFRLLCPYTLVRSKRVCGYELDGYLPEVNVAIEFDEEHHLTSRQEQRDWVRMVEVANRIKCSFIRVQDRDWYSDPEGVYAYLLKTIEDSRAYPVTFHIKVPDASIGRVKRW